MFYLRFMRTLSPVFLVVIVCLFFHYSLGPIVAQANTTTATLDALTVSLNEIGEQITNSPDLTDEERLALLTQLVAISNQIVQLRLTMYSAAPPSPPEGSNRVSVKDIRLRQVVMDIDVEAARVVATLHYAATTQTRTYQLTRSQGSSFEAQVDEYRAQALPRLARDLRVIDAELDDLTYVTAYNPIRETQTRWQQNEDSLLDLGLNMGRYSVIESVNVYTHYTGTKIENSARDNGSARIEIMSDQGELAILTMSKNNLAEDSDEVTFSYSYELYIPFENDGDWYDSDDGPVPPKIYQSEPSADADEMLEVLYYTFYGVPFVQFVPGYDSSLLDFLLENQARAFLRRVTSDFDVSQCFNPYDATIVTELVRYLLDAGGAQSLNFDANFNLIPMIDTDREGSLDVESCYVSPQIF